MALPQYILHRSRRKTISMRLTKQLELEVRAPMQLPVSQVEAFVAKHSDWVARQMEVLAQRQQARQSFGFASGDRLYFLGQPIVVSVGSYPQPVCVEEGKLCIHSGVTQPQAAVEKYLRDFAWGYIGPLVERWIGQMGVEPTGMRITGATTRWGSCSGAGRVCFSYRILCLPPSLIEYVVVHELAHLRHLNHSGDFYREVERYLPHWRQSRQQLKLFEDGFPF